MKPNSTMSKLKCKCGNVIVDQTDNLINKATFIRDQNIEEVLRRIRIISEYINSIKNGNRKEWLEKYFGNDIYHDLDDSSVINDILLKTEAKYESVMYHCNECGSIMIQKNKENIFISFTPTDSDWDNIFKGL